VGLCPLFDSPLESPNQVEIVSGNVVDIPLNQDILINQNNQNRFSGPEEPMILPNDKNIPNKQFDMYGFVSFT
jgi:hypothetical protein